MNEKELEEKIDEILNKKILARAYLAQFYNAGSNGSEFSKSDADELEKQIRKHILALVRKERKSYAKQSLERVQKSLLPDLGDMEDVDDIDKIEVYDAIQKEIGRL